MRIIAAGVLLALLTSGRCQNANCDFSQNVRPFMTYYLDSPGYPRNYTAGVQCRWIGICPSGYNCRLECPDINLPQSPRCSIDRLLVSRTGDRQLTSADYYCGRGTLNVTSDRQRLSVGLKSSNQSPGGKFLCRLTAQPETVATA